MAAQQVLPSVQIRVVVGPLGRYSESTNIPLPGSMAKKNVDFSASLQPLRKGRTKAPMHHVWRALCNMLASETFSPELRAILSEDYAATMAVRWDIHNMTIQCSKGEGSEWLDGAPEFVGFVREFQEAHRLGYPLLESEYMEPTVFSVALKKSMDGVGDRWSEQEARPETHYSLQIYIPTLEIDETLRTLMVPYGISGSSAHTSTIDASDVGMDDRQGRFIPGIPTSNIHQPLYSTTYPESTSVNTPPPSAKLLYNSKDTIDPRIISNPFYQIDEEQTNTINESLAFSSPPLQFQQLSSPILHRVAGDASSSSSSSRQHIPSSPTASLSAAVSGAPSTSIERPLAQPSQLHFWDLLRRTEQQYTFMFYSRDDQELLQKGQKIILVMNLLVELGFDLDADPDTAIAIEGLPYGPKLSMRRVLNSLRYCRYSFFKWRTMILWISDITTIDFTDLNPKIMQTLSSDERLELQERHWIAQKIFKYPTGWMWRKYEEVQQEKSQHQNDRRIALAIQCKKRDLFYGRFYEQMCSILNFQMDPKYLDYKHSQKAEGEGGDPDSSFEHPEPTKSSQSQHLMSQPPPKGSSRGPGSSGASSSKAKPRFLANR